MSDFFIKSLLPESKNINFFMCKKTCSFYILSVPLMDEMLSLLLYFYIHILYFVL